VFVGEARTAVAADVQQGADDAVVASHHHDRPTGDVVGEILAGLADVAAQRHEQRHAEEDPLDLLGVLGRVSVRSRRHLHRGVAHVGQTCLDVRPQPIEEFVEHHGQCCTRLRRWSSDSDRPLVAP